MAEDPAYQREGEVHIKFKDRIFGYTRAVEKDGKIVAIGGEGDEVPYLEVGDRIKPKGEYAELGGLEPLQEAEIVSFQKPFEAGGTDHIVLVRQGDKMAAIKPYQLEKMFGYVPSSGKKEQE